MAELVNTRKSSRLTNAATPRPIGLLSKRIIDIILASSGIILLAPLLTLCFLACLLSSPGPAVFRHQRVGFRGKLFDCFKFRTMVSELRGSPSRISRIESCGRGGVVCYPQASI